MRNISFCTYPARATSKTQDKTHRIKRTFGLHHARLALGEGAQRGHDVLSGGGVARELVRPEVLVCVNKPPELSARAQRAGEPAQREELERDEERARGHGRD